MTFNHLENTLLAIFLYVGIVSAAGAGDFSFNELFEDSPQVIRASRGAKGLAPISEGQSYEATPHADVTTPPPIARPSRAVSDGSRSTESLDTSCVMSPEADSPIIDVPGPLTVTVIVLGNDKKEGYIERGEESFRFSDYYSLDTRFNLNTFKRLLFSDAMECASAEFKTVCNAIALKKGGFGITNCLELRLNIRGYGSLDLTEEKEWQQKFIDYACTECVLYVYLKA